MQPTQEQQRCIDIFKTGGHLTIEAGAGTGKTSTLVLLAEAERQRRGQYLAFNKAIVEDAKRKMPPNVTASTMHSLAWGTFGRRYAKRLNSPRMASYELARRLGTLPVKLTLDGVEKFLSDAYLASMAIAAITNFCHSADGKRTYANNNAVRELLMPGMRKAWDDLRNPGGQIPFKHDHYLKMWQLSRPIIAADFVLFDEAQDADPVMLAVVEQQTQAQLILVGDTNQAIYEWRGAVNAMEKLPFQRAFLAQSFRFGPPIAEVANTVLDRIGADLRLRGLPTLSSYVNPLANHSANAVLCRTNAGAIETAMTAQAANLPTYLMGGAEDVLRFVRSARALQHCQRATHPDLMCFDSWAAVQDYVSADPQGSELALLVKLVDDFGVDRIEQALSQTHREGPGVLTVSTAHKAKGRQWQRVRLANDFKCERLDRNGKPQEPSTAELRLMYVAVTRAQTHLDCEAISKIVWPDKCRETVERL